MGKYVVNLTPSKIGEYYIPVISEGMICDVNNYNMVTCGGQVSVPIAAAVARTHSEVRYIEVVTSLASKSAGAATRENLDHYIATTQDAIKRFSGAKEAKAVLILNPAELDISMTTTIYAEVVQPNIELFSKDLEKTMQQIHSYMPEYEIIYGPCIVDGVITLTIKVNGKGDHLPEYAGNLGIINCAAISFTEKIALTLSNGDRGINVLLKYTMLL
jgi:acetaldehyde dehydrogenase